MMKVNFKIEDNIALAFAGRLIDLHNVFDFTGFDYRVAEKELTLTWQKFEEYGASVEFSHVRLKHKAVSFFKVTEQDENTFPGDDQSLAEISYVPSTARNINDVFFVRAVPEESDDIIYTYNNGQVVRVHCEEIELTVSPIEQ